MEQEKNEEEFFESVVMMLNFCLNDAYLLDTKQSKHGFLNLKSTYITKIYMDNSEENMSYLDDVKASYDPSFELARGLNLKEWEKFFKGEKCDILDYVLENVPKLFLRYDFKLGVFVCNYYITNYFGDGNYACIWGWDKSKDVEGYNFNDSISPNLEKFIEPYQKKYPEFFFDRLFTFVYSLGPSLGGIRNLNYLRRNLNYIKEDIEEIYNRVYGTNKYWKFNVEYDPDDEESVKKELEDLNKDVDQQSEDDEEYDEETERFFDIYGCTLLAKSVFEGRFSKNEKPDIVALSDLIGDFMAYAMKTISEIGLSELDDDQIKILETLKEDVEKQLSKI